ncbi:MAG: GspH/FimT family pseudopilin [Magnetococcus sp. THC-1_WYH]
MFVRSQPGYTLVELLITLAIALIVSVLAVPFYETIMQNSRMVARVNMVLGTLHYARGEAIKQRQQVSICDSTDGATCTASGNWELGWLVFVDADSSESFTAGDTVLKVYESIAAGNATLRGDTNAQNVLSFSSDGFSRSAAGVLQTGNLVYCDSRGIASGKVITLTFIGRTRSYNPAAVGVTQCDPP